MTIQITDRSVSYDVFVADVAAAVVAMMKEPEFISQNEAFRRFGRKNVERWRDSGRIEPCKRPGKMEYRLSELRRLKNTKQDYF